MSYGKEVCKKLKEIRQQIADKNEIAYATDDCHFDGECQGTCPKCDAELRYIETELHKRKHFGKAAAVAGISLGVAMSFSGCLKGDPKPSIPEGDMPPDSTYTNNSDSSLLMGLIYNGEDMSGF
ncbi:MAG: hypothetical protein FWH36_09735 [Lentimicrobiaceae bacterium]|nr:hypothetical protein [Lentimicrobiaceae bacterium]